MNGFRRDAGWYALILPAFLLMSVFYIAPIVQVLAISFTEPQPGLGNYERLFTSESIQRVIVTTLRICLITTVLALLLGYVLSYRIALSSARAQAFMQVLVERKFPGAIVEPCEFIPHRMLLGRERIADAELNGARTRSEEAKRRRFPLDRHAKR